MKIIGISGKLHVGKDTFADFLEPNLYNYERIGFADLLKQTAADLLGIDVGLLYDQGFKETEMGEEWNRWTKISTGKHFVPTGKFDPENLEVEKRTMTYRKFLQDLGEGARKFVHLDIWVNGLFNKVKASDHPVAALIITDVRYPNEADNILERGGVVVRINRSDELRKIENYSWEELNAESEIALDDYDRFTEVYQNDGTLEDLKKFANKIASL